MRSIGDIINGKDFSRALAERRFPPLIERVVVDDQPITGLVAECIDAAFRIRPLGGSEPFGVSEIAYLTDRLGIDRDECVFFGIQQLAQMFLQMSAQKAHLRSAFL